MGKELIKYSKIEEEKEKKEKAGCMENERYEEYQYPQKATLILLQVGREKLHYRTTMHHGNASKMCHKDCLRHPISDRRKQEFPLKSFRLPFPGQTKDCPHLMEMESKRTKYQQNMDENAFLMGYGKKKKRESGNIKNEIRILISCSQ